MKTDVNLDAQPVLDHGFVRVVDLMGDDAAVVQAARISYGDGTKTPSDDRNLIRYLMRHRHTSPFEMCEIKLHVKLPIFVARQWIRHRTANVNEYSGRYSEMKEEFYVPEHPEAQSSANKQGGSGVVKNEEFCRLNIQNANEESFETYRVLLHEGMSREQARIPLPLGTYTEWYWKTDVHNLLHFLKLRMDRHAQGEIRAYADVIYEIVKQWMPITLEAWEDFSLNAVTISGPLFEGLKTLVLQPDDDFERSLRELIGNKISKREIDDFITHLRG